MSNRHETYDHRADALVDPKGQPLSVTELDLVRQVLTFLDRQAEATERLIPQTRFSGRAADHAAMILYSGCTERMHAIAHLIRDGWDIEALTLARSLLEHTAVLIYLAGGADEAERDARAVRFIRTSLEQGLKAHQELARSGFPGASQDASDAQHDNGELLNSWGAHSAKRVASASSSSKIDRPPPGALRPVQEFYGPQLSIGMRMELERSRSDEDVSACIYSPLLSTERREANDESIGQRGRSVHDRI